MVVSNIFLTMLCLSFTRSAPMQMQILPYQSVLVQQQQIIQEQLLQLQAMQKLNQISAPIPLNNQLPPMLFFLPEHEANKKIDEKQPDNIDINKSIATSNADDSDSVVIDSEPVPIIEEQKAFLMLPNGRLSIGGIISAIPFLPIEINVPDTISWAYNGIANGIAGIISIIGQRLPFQRPPTEAATKGLSLKSFVNDLQLRKEQDSFMGPIIMMPIDRFRTPILPVQL